MEVPNFCPRCGVPWEPGKEHCDECGKMLEYFRPGQPKVIRLDEARQGYQEFTVIGGMPDEV